MQWASPGGKPQIGQILMGGSREEQPGWSSEPSGEGFGRGAGKIGGLHPKSLRFSWLDTQPRGSRMAVGKLLSKMQKGADRAIKRVRGEENNRTLLLWQVFFRASLARKLRAKINFCKFWLYYLPSHSPLPVLEYKLHVGGDFCPFASPLNCKHLEHFLAHGTRIIEIAQGVFVCVSCFPHP